MKMRMTVLQKRMMMTIMMMITTEAMIPVRLEAALPSTLLRLLRVTAMTLPSETGEGEIGGLGVAGDREDMIAPEV